MGLINSSLQIGRSSIMAHNLALDVTGNNIANSGTEGYARQVVEMESVRGVKTIQGPVVGLGVSAASIRRVTDVYLEQRLRDARSALQSADVQSSTLMRMESAFNELTDSDLSSILNDFFEALSTLQTTPEEMSVRRGVVETGITLSENIRMLRDRVDGLRRDIEAEVSGVVDETNSLTSEIAQLNMEIARVAATAADSGGATALLDRRDTLLGKLSDLIDMRVVAMKNGTVNIFVGSDPLVMLDRNYELATKTRTDRGVAVSDVVFASDGRTVDLDGGKLEGLIAARDQSLPLYVDALDLLAGEVIKGFNNIHTSGQGINRYSALDGATSVDDTTATLDAAGLWETPRTGTFDINIVNVNTGEERTVRIHVDLDGYNADDTTLDSLVAKVNAQVGALFPEIQASVGPGNVFRMSSSVSELEFSFASDTSGVLSALGVNTFFAGHDATDIAINDLMIADPGYIAASLSGLSGDNANVTQMLGFQFTRQPGLSGMSVEEFYRSTVTALAVTSAAAQDRRDATLTVYSSLKSQREALSGVSLDEEAVKLIAYQTGFQAAARFITTVQELLQVLLAM